MIFAAIDVLSLANVSGLRFFCLAECVIWSSLNIFAALLWIYFPEDFALASVLNIAKSHVQTEFAQDFRNLDLFSRDEDKSVAQFL
jgi:hypothetical protein